MPCPAAMHSHTWIRPAFLLATLVLAVPQQAPAAGRVETVAAPANWTSYRDPRMGFALDFPASIFAAVKSDPTAALARHTSRRSGLALASRDGRASLLVAVFENVDRAPIERYRARALAANYKDARITFQRSEEDWFVVSGFRGQDIFYERVVFSCGGKVINVWGLIYPSADRQVYDRVVESVAVSFRPVARRDSGC